MEQDQDKKGIDNIFMDLAHDRGICNLLNVDYNNLTKEDEQKLMTYAAEIYWMKKITKK